MLILKEISKEELQYLLKCKIIYNTNVGFVNNKGKKIGYYRTIGKGRKRYIEDLYVHQAKKLINSEK